MSESYDSSTMRDSIFCREVGFRLSGIFLSVFWRIAPPPLPAANPNPSCLSASSIPKRSQVEQVELGLQPTEPSHQVACHSSTPFRAPLFEFLHSLFPPVLICLYLFSSLLKSSFIPLSLACPSVRKRASFRFGFQNLDVSCFLPLKVQCSVAKFHFATQVHFFEDFNFHFWSWKNFF